uniref:Uncharacterized protein n=1 Tax=Cacopsylla melanoneura TaxID=428564 RepID=A0A8D8Z392_9HEMI
MPPPLVTEGAGAPPTPLPLPSLPPLTLPRHIRTRWWCEDDWVARTTLSPPCSLTEIMSSVKDSIAKDDSACGSSSGSVSSTEDRSRKTSTTSQTKRGEVYV